MTKDELRLKVQELELTLSSLNLNTKTVKDELTEAETKLENIGRPVIDDVTVDKLYEIISRSFDEFDPNEYDPDYEFELDYEGKINVNSIELSSLDDFASQMHDRILQEFNIVNENDE